MAQDAVILRFPGDPTDLAKRYGEGLRRFAAKGATVRPETVFVGRDERDANMLVVVLLWPKDIDHEILSRHFLGSLTELGLPRPAKVDHVQVEAVGWEAVAGLGA